MGGFHVGPALVLAAGSLLNLRLVPGFGRLPRLPILQSDALGLRFGRVIATAVSCLDSLAGLLLPVGFQEFVELLLGGEIPASREAAGRALVEGTPSPAQTQGTLGKGTEVRLLMGSTPPRSGQLPVGARL